MEQSGRGKSQSTTPKLAWVGLIKTTKTVRIIDILAEIRTRRLPNTSQKRITQAK
jgi:hypothetical protein